MSKPYYDLAQSVSEKTGLPADWVWAQWAHETGGFKSQLMRENWNFGGLTQVEPNGEENKQPDGGNYYMKFNSPEEYADYFARYIKLYEEDGVFNAQNVDEYVQALKRGGYFGDSVEKYTAGVKNFLSNGSYSLSGVFQRGTDAFGAKPPVVPTVEPTMPGFWEKTKDKFLDTVYDTSIIGTVRHIWNDVKYSGFNDPRDYRLSQEDVDYVTKLLPGDFTAQKYVLMNARNKEHLLALVQMKQEDEARRARVEGYKFGLHSIVGGAAGILADPLTFLPLGQEAVLLKALGRLGGVAAKMSLSKVAKYAELAATNAAINVADRKVAEKVSGYEQDYNMAALIGGVAGGGLGMLGDLVRAGVKNRGVRKTYSVLQGMEGHAAAHVNDVRLPNEVPMNTRGEFKNVHDSSYLKGFNSETVSKMADSDSIFAVTKKQARSISKQIGIDIPETAKAFHNPLEGYTVLIKDNIKDTDNIENILAHEVGVHANLKTTLGDKLYNDVMNFVDKNIEKPEGKWAEAIKATPGGGKEEVLGHWIERSNLNDPMFKRITSGLNKSLRKIGLNTPLTETEVKDFIKKSMALEAEKAQGYRVLEDGTAVWNGMKFSNANIFHPHNMAHVYDLDTKDIAQEGLKGSALKKFGQVMEAGRIFGTIGGVLRNSKSPMGRALGDLLFHNSRMGNYKGGLVMPAEKIKEHLVTRFNTHWGNYLDIRNKYLYDTLMSEGIPTVSRINEFDRQVVECFDSMYAGNNSGLNKYTWPDAVSQAANVLKALREDMVDVGKKSSAMFGSGRKNLIESLNEAELRLELEYKGVPDETIDKIVEHAKKTRGYKDWQPNDLGLWRVLDEDKWINFTQKFPHPDKAIEFLTDYAKRFAKRDVIEKKLMDIKQLEYEQALIEWQKKIKKEPTGGHVRPEKPAKAKGKDVEVSDKPQKPTVTEKEIDEWIEKESTEWAKGVIDRDNSNLEMIKHGKEGGLSFLKERFPMDTSGIMETPWGESFTFDKTLRATDLDRIVPKVINRFSGEAALQNAFDSVTSKKITLDDGRAIHIDSQLDNQRAKFISQLQHAVANGHMTEEQLAREVKALDDGIASIRGIRAEGDVKTKWQAFARLFNSLSFAQNGANMVFNQFGELGGALAYTGGRAITHLVPGVSDFIRSARYGKAFSQTIKEAEMRAFGESLEAKVWSTNFESRVFKEVTTNDSILRHLDSVGTGLNVINKAVGQAYLFSSLPKLTDRMIRGARTDTMIDSIEWAAGKKFSVLRNPFSTKKLKAAGVDNAMAQQIKGDINKYVSRDANGNITDFNIDKWMEESPATFWKWKFLVDNQSMRAVQQASIGNKNILKESNAFFKMMFHFRDFTLRTVNGQTMRALTNREMDDFLAAMFSMGTNMMVYAGLTQAKAYAYFPNDKGKREEYLEAQLAPERLAMAAFLRGTVTGSIAGFGWDAYEAAFGKQSLRTTVDRTSQFQGKKAYGEPRDTGDVIGNVVEQFPGMRAATSLGQVGYIGYKAVHPDLDVTKKDVKTLVRSLPLSNYLPMAYLAGQLIDESRLPDKDPKKLK